MTEQPEEPPNPFLVVKPVVDFASLDEFEDEAAWLADQLDGADSLSSLDSQLSQLSNQLDAAAADTTAQSDRSIDEIARSVPRLTYDLQLMREHALLLRFTLDGIRKRSGASTADESTTKVMERLRQLDTVKSRMESTRDVLREAESWSTLDSEVTSMISEQAYGKAADRLAEAARSMVVFQNTPEYEGRRSLMISLQNGLEASLSASLVAAINVRDVKACKSFFALFGQIQREAEFRNYYFGSRRAHLVSSWQAANLSDCRTDASAQMMGDPVTFADFLPTFFADLRSVMDQEATYIPSIFPDPLVTLSAFLQTTIDALVPSFHQRLTEMMESHGAKALLELIRAYHATEEFAVSIDSIMARLSAAAALSSAPIPTLDLPTPGSYSSGSSAPTTPAAKERRGSKRFSVSRRSSARTPSFSSQSFNFSLSDGGSGESEARPWEIGLYEPFLDWQVEYGLLERTFLEASTEAAFEVKANGAEAGRLLTASSSSADTRLLWDQMQGVMQICEDALSRVIALTHGYGSCSYIEAADICLSSFLANQREALEQVKLKRQRSAAIHASSASEVASKGGEHGTDADLEGLDYSAEDWAGFQLGLKLLGTCRQLSKRMQTLEERLRTRLSTSVRTLQQLQQDPSAQVIPGTTRGAVALLRQSTLNSAELVSLIDDLAPTSSDNSSHSRAVLLTISRTTSIELAKACQLLLHDTILRPLFASLIAYPNLSVWSASADSRQDNKSAFDLNMPTFSLSPTDLISRLGEGLFNLPRLFEVYADDDALAFSIETLPFVDAASLTSATASSTAPSAPATPHSSKRHVSHGEADGSTAKREAEIRPLSAEDVISTWLTSLTLSVLAHLTADVLPSLRTLSSHGAAQLASDLSHISNVAKALDVESEELERWQECAEMSDAEGKKAMAGEASEIDRIQQHMARLRKWQ